MEVEIFALNLNTYLVKTDLVILTVANVNYIFKCHSLNRTFDVNLSTSMYYFIQIVIVLGGRGVIKWRK